MAKNRKKKDDPDFPAALLELPRGGTLTTVDFGLMGSGVATAESARAGDKESKRIANKALKMFLGLMKNDRELRVRRNQKNLPMLDEDGEYLVEDRSKWDIRGMEGAMGVHQDNPSAEPDLWQEKVKKHWLTIVLPGLKFFSHVPSPDPKSTHTESLIRNVLDRNSPTRRESLHFLDEHDQPSWNDLQDQKSENGELVMSGLPDSTKRGPGRPRKPKHEDE